MDTSEVEPKSSLAPILNYSTSSDVSSIIVTGNMGRRLSLLENISIENETILSKCTNESTDDMREHNIWRFDKVDRKSPLIAYNGNSIEDLSFIYDKNFELNSELEDIISFENSDLSILMKSRNSAILRKDIFKHFYKLNVLPLISQNETLNDTQNNLTLPSQKKNSNNFIKEKFHVPLTKLENSHSTKFSSFNQGNKTLIENTTDLINRSKESEENSIISPSFENEKSHDRYTNEKKNLYQNNSNYNIELSCTYYDMKSSKKNILRNKLKHCELKLFDYLIEQETYDGKQIEKNELIDKVFNNNSTKEIESVTGLCNKENRLKAENGNINNSISEKDNFGHNLFKNRLITGNNEESVREFINYFRKYNSLGYEFDKSNLYQYTDDSLYESINELSNKEKINIKYGKDENDENNISKYQTFLEDSNLHEEKTKIKLDTNEKSIKRNNKDNEKNHSIYSKFGNCNKLKFDVETIVGKISEIKKISPNDNNKIKDIRSSTTSYESDDSLNLEYNKTIHISDRVSSRLRNMHMSKPKSTKSKVSPKRITEEDIKKVVHNITLTPMSSKDNLRINNRSNRNRLREFPQNIKYKNKTKTYLKTADIRKFIWSKLLPCSSKTNTLLDCEDVIQKVNIAVKNAQSKKANMNTIIMTLQELLYEKNICKTYIEFYTFISNFTPFSFQKNIMPLSGAFGCNGPKITKKLSDPLR
ncbi:unnamed protein product [Nezara viridula]|uniref:Uncharacterized protein n=1 Tax=Nezara viridula TaxID=85310 RepID=A0A9P0H9J9_NEZVI|nr:unnamed protein product [Nezara viridula]